MTIYVAQTDGKILPIPTNKNGKYKVVSFPFAASHPSVKDEIFIVHKALGANPDYKWCITVMGTGLRFSFGQTMQGAIDHGMERFRKYDDARIALIIQNAKNTFAPRLQSRGLVESL